MIALQEITMDKELEQSLIQMEKELLKLKKSTDFLAGLEETGKNLKVSVLELGDTNVQSIKQFKSQLDSVVSIFKKEITTIQDGNCESLKVFTDSVESGIQKFHSDLSEYLQVFSKQAITLSGNFERNNKEWQNTSQKLSTDYARISTSILKNLQSSSESFLKTTDELLSQSADGFQVKLEDELKKLKEAINTEIDSINDKISNILSDYQKRLDVFDEYLSKTEGILSELTEDIIQKLSEQRADWENKLEGAQSQFTAEVNRVLSEEREISEDIIKKISEQREIWKKDSEALQIKFNKDAGRVIDNGLEINRKVSDTNSDLLKNIDSVNHLVREIKESQLEEKMTIIKKNQNSFMWMLVFNLALTLSGIAYIIYLML
jgi:conjugal transfer/entry exclusion protein